MISDDPCPRLLNPATDLVPVHARHPSLHGSDSNVPQIERLSILDKDAGEQSDEVLGVHDRVGRVRRHRDTDGLDKLVMPQPIPLRNLLRHLAVGSLGLAEQERLCGTVKDRVSRRVRRGSGEVSSRDALA